MTKRDWWIAVALLVAALLAHAAFPRYEWRDMTGAPFLRMRIDRWTGGAVLGTFGDGGQWVSLRDRQAAEDATAKKHGGVPVPTAAASPFLSTDPAAVDSARRPFLSTDPNAATLPAIGEELPLALQPTQFLPIGAEVPLALQPPPPGSLCDSKALLRPASGSELGGKYRGGLGRLKIVNGTERDAVAVLVDNATEAPKRAIYIRSGEVGAITSVPNGNYRLRFQLGQRWLRERRFCEPANTSEFNDAFDFREVATGGGTKYSTFEVTLHPVVDGTAKTHSLSNTKLMLPIPDAGLDDPIARKYGGVVK